MSNEGLPQTQETRKERLSREYHSAVLRYQKLKEVVPEAGALMFRDRPATTDEERLMATLTIEQSGYAGEAEAYAQRGEAGAERAFRMFEQMKEAEAQIAGLYLDARQYSDELAEVIAREHPWVAERLSAANDAQYVVEEKRAA